MKNLLYEIENVLEVEGAVITDGVALAEEAGYTVIAHHDDCANLYFDVREG